MRDRFKGREGADQVLVRYQKFFWRLVPGGEKPAQVLAVDQAWIWKLGDVIISAPLDVGWPGKAAWEKGESDSALSLCQTIGIFMAELVGSLDAPYTSNVEDIPDERVLDVVETAIGLLAEKARVYTEGEKDGVEAISVRIEGEMLHQINNIKDELCMIKRVLAQQEEVWREFASNAWPDFWLSGGEDGARMRIPSHISRAFTRKQAETWRAVLSPQTQFREYERQISQLGEDAERIEKSINTQLDLKAKDATLRETHATAEMSAAVFGFTIITIIFSPLSFVAAVFALPIDSVLSKQIENRWTDEAGMFRSVYVGKYFGE